MFSINPGPSRCTAKAFIHLHSTMFSINRFPKGLHAFQIHDHLHSTMFSINPSSIQFFRFRKIHLHSTMFSINRARREPLERLERIYIPLCFLLIKIEKARTLPGEIHLHSTMFSINPGNGRKTGCWIKIYIPLCFLLIMIRIIYQVFTDVIYIPLCFLLIVSGSMST